METDAARRLRLRTQATTIRKETTNITQHLIRMVKKGDKRAAGTQAMIDAVLCSKRHQHKMMRIVGRHK